jgi:hypothetical protein
MLIDKNNSDILALPGVAIEGFCNLCFFRLTVNHKEISLRIWGLGDMPDTGKQESSDRIFVPNHCDELAILGSC